MPLELDIAAVYEPISGLLKIRGTAEAGTLLNRNSSGRQNDITLNRISRIEYRLDDGSWITASSPNVQTTDINLSISIPENFTTIDLRAVDAATGITSNLVTVDRNRPTSGGGVSVEGFAFVDDNDNETWEESEFLLPGVTVQIADPSGIYQGQIEPDQTPGAIYTRLAPNYQIRSVGNQVDGRVAAFSGTTATGANNFHYASIFGTWGDSWSRVRQELEITLNESTNRVSIAVVGKGPDSIGRLEGFDADGNLVARATSDLLAINQSQVLVLDDPAGRIESIRAYGTAGTSVSLDDFRYGPEISSTSDVFGTFEFKGLPDGTYTVNLESPSSQFAIVDATQTMVVVGGVGTPLTVIAERTTSRWTNPTNPFDTNNSGVVQPIDALIIINDLNRNGARVLTTADLTPPYLDVNGDLSVTPINALRIVNFLNRNSGGQSNSGGEGELDSGPMMGWSLVDGGLLGGNSADANAGWSGVSKAEGESTDSETGWLSAVDKIWGNLPNLGSQQVSDPQNIAGKHQETILESPEVSEINGTIDINLSLSSISNGLFGRSLGKS